MNNLVTLLTDSCVIENYERNRAVKTAAESWIAQPRPVRCKMLKRESTLFSPDKSTSTVTIRTRFVLPGSATIGPRDRIAIEGRKYEVIDTVKIGAPRTTHHKIAICKAVGMPKVSE